METYDGPFSMIQSIEDLESLLEHLSEEEIHDTPIKEHPSSYLRKEAIKQLIKEYEVSLNTRKYYEDRNIHNNHVEEFLEEPLFGDIVENHPHITLT